MVNVWDVPVSVHLQGVSYLVRVNRMTRVTLFATHEIICYYYILLLWITALTL